jgi:hypothetical protein
MINLQLQHSIHNYVGLKRYKVATKKVTHNLLLITQLAKRCHAVNGTCCSEAAHTALLPAFVMLQAGYDLVEIPAFNADKLDGVCTTVGQQTRSSMKATNTMFWHLICVIHHAGTCSYFNTCSSHLVFNCCA